MYWAPVVELVGRGSGMSWTLADMCCAVEGSDVAADRCVEKPGASLGSVMWFLLMGPFSHVLEDARADVRQ